MSKPLRPRTRPSKPRPEIEQGGGQKLYSFSVMEATDAVRCDLSVPRRDAEVIGYQRPEVLHTPRFDATSSPRPR